jgi:hypothetical protein
MRRAVLISALALVPLTGCLITGSIDPSGGAHLTVNIHLVSVAHFDSMKAALQSPDVVLKSASMTPQKFATFELECAHVEKLSTAPSISHAAIALSDVGGGSRTLAVSIFNPAPEPWSERLQRYLGNELKIAITLPGDVSASNAMATNGRTVSWSWPFSEASTLPRADLWATYKPSGASGPTS